MGEVRSKSACNSAFLLLISQTENESESALIKEIKWIIYSINMVV